MTFKEFFIKKKIDLTQLQRAKPALVEEFQSHYDAMGEKSFDHTKKYWFNKLRKDFLLVEKELPSNKIPLTTPTPTAKAGNPSPSTAKPSGFKPRFKPMTAAKPMDETSHEDTDTPQQQEPQTPAKPMGFKPRFKAGTTPVAKPTEDKPEAPAIGETDNEANEQEPKTPAKPMGFKPRFKAGTTPVAKPNEDKPEAPAPEEPANKAEEQESKTPAKPIGFKPRFKPGITGKKEEGDN